MLPSRRIFGVFVLILATVSGTEAQEYRSVIVFGDSLSDSGNVAEFFGLPPGTAFTTNPDPNWAKIVAQTFGDAGKNSGLDGSGSNFAVGGACVHPEASCDERIPKIGRQIDMHLGRTLGKADPAALYAVWGGLNDIESILTPGDDAVPVDPQTAAGQVVRAAQAMVDHVRRLQEAGARHIAVFNLPDPGSTPFAAAAAQANPQLPIVLTSFAELYNRHLDQGLRSLGTGIVPINAFALFDEIIGDPATYGFTDVQGTACSGVAPGLPSVGCGPSGSGSPSTHEPGTNRTHLFADPRHPSGAAHAIVASAVVSTLQAPVQVSLAGEAGVAAASSHRRAVFAENTPALARAQEVGRWRAYARARMGRDTVDALPRLGEARADVRAVTLGASHRATADLSWGAALSLGSHDNDIEGADLGSDTVIGSVNGTWRRGGFHLNGALIVGRSRIDVERSIRLGPASRTENGSTEAGLFGMDVDLGWTFQETGSIRHGPVFGLSWLDQEVDGYREKGSSSTAMDFSGFDRDSVVLRGGYRISGAMDLQGVSLRPYAGMAYEREFNDDPVSVTAGSNTMAGRFSASGFAPPDQWFTADIGVSASLDGLTSAEFGYSGRYGDRSRKVHRVNLGLRLAF